MKCFLACSRYPPPPQQSTLRRGQNKFCFHDKLKCISSPSQVRYRYTTAHFNRANDYGLGNCGFTETCTDPCNLHVAPKRTAKSPSPHPPPPPKKKKNTIVFLFTLNAPCGLQVSPKAHYKWCGQNKCFPDDIKCFFAPSRYLPKVHYL